MRHRDILLFLILLSLFFVGEAVAQNDGRYGQACDNVVNLMKGPFGAMLTSVSGVGAIVASAMGGFKMAWGLLVVSASSFILRGYMDVFFQGKCV